MDQQNSKVKHVKVSDWSSPPLHSIDRDNFRSGPQETVCEFITRSESREAVCPAHEPISEIVDVSGSSPPAAGQQSASGSGLDVFQVSDARIIGIRPETILLVVGSAEDVVADPLHGENGCHVGWSQHDGVDGEVAGLDGVDEWHPDEISERKHETKPVSRQIHSREDCRLVEQCVEDVDGLGDGDHEHGVGDVSVRTVLLGHPGKVENHPADHSWTKLHEGLDVNLAKERNVAARVELATNVPIIDNVAGVPACCQFSHLSIASFDREGANVDPDGKRVCDDDVAGEELDVVVVDEGPDGESGALNDGSRGEDDEHGNGREEGWIVLLALSRPRLFSKIAHH